MKRMIDDAQIKNKLALPSESNLIYCAQFVSDRLVLNNVEEGIYCIKLLMNEGDNVSAPLMFVDFKYESTYGTFFGNFFYDDYNGRILALKGEYSQNSKTLTFSIIDTTGTPITSAKEFHIDVYKVGE